MNHSVPPIIVQVRDSGLSTGIKLLLVVLNLVFLPLPGLVWWLVIREDKPRTARDVARMTRLSVGLWLLLILGAMMLGILLG